MISVFYCFCRTAADAGHAVCTVFTPFRLTADDRDVIQRTVLLTFAAADASVCGIELLCVNHRRIIDRVDQTAFDFT